MAQSFPSFTSKWHDDTYATISPSGRPELSMRGKRVIVGGGDTGVGRGIAKAFAEAGATSVVLLGRRRAYLNEAQRTIGARYGRTTISARWLDVVSRDAVERVASAIGNWDVLIVNAAHCAHRAKITDSEPDDWWKGFEVNVKGTFNLLRTFLPTSNAGATVVCVSTASLQIPTLQAMFSSYNASKLAETKLMEAVAAEYPEVHAVTFHHGFDLTTSNDVHPAHNDVSKLCSHFAVWLCSEEARFLRGKFVWANWDVEELLARKEEIEGSLLLTANIIGYPYPFTITSTET